MEKIVCGINENKGIKKNWAALNYEFNSDNQMSILYFDDKAECLMFYGESQELIITNSGNHTILHRYIERIFNDYVYRHHKRNMVLIDGESCFSINKIGYDYLLSFVCSSDNINYFNLRALNQIDYITISNFLVFLFNGECQIEIKNTKSL